MKIEVRLFATLAAYLPENSEDDRVLLELGDGATVAHAARRLKIPDVIPCLTVVNGCDADSEHVLTDGDVLTMFPPLAGGR